MKLAIFAPSDAGVVLAKKIQTEITTAQIFSTRIAEGVQQIDSIKYVIADIFEEFDSILFVGALGICVRSIAPHIVDKKTDPAVVCVDVNGAFVQSVLSGHVGGANELAERIARITGRQAVISTASDTQDLWALDLLAKQFNWKQEVSGDMTAIIASLVNQEPIALLLEARDKGTAYLEKTCPENVTIHYSYDEVDFSTVKTLLAVTPFIYSSPVQSILYRPSMLSLGVGCRKAVPVEEFQEALSTSLKEHNIAIDAVDSIYSIDVKKDEPAIVNYATVVDKPFVTFSSDELGKISVPNPSQKVFDTVGCYGVAEASALMGANRPDLYLEKQKASTDLANNLTFSVAILPEYERSAFVHIVGAGPGDPELVSVRGKRLLQQADLILYAGSLVPEELTHYAKPGATVLSSAGMNLDEQIACMDEFYKKGLMIVRLHTGDPCLYGAIQEQMGKMDEKGMSYSITPGISAFQAAAAQLKSQFTVPERVQSIILTRGEGRTPVPEKEQLHKMAQSQSTMCIYLSATLVEQVQKDLLTSYPEDTPVAVCHKLTWPEEKIWRGQLKDLAHIVKSNNLTLTTLLVVGEAIDARGHYSKLYDKHFTHGTRKAVEK